MGEPEVPWPIAIFPPFESVKVGTYTPSLTVVVCVIEPEVPVMVSVYCPGLAVLVATRVRVDSEVVGFALQEAVTPLGRPDVTVMVTLPVNPNSLLTEMLVVPELPWPMLTPPEFESVKPGAATVRAIVLVAVSAPEVPVMVTLAVPKGAELLAVNVSALVPVVGLVPQDALTPLGRVEVTARFTLPANPY